MNQPQNSEPGTGNTFASQPSQASNPFTADLKGEFTSNFGTNANTNAVSQIFKDGGFVSQNRTKWIFIGVAVLAVLVIAFFLMTGDESVDEFATEETPAEETTAATDAAPTAEDAAAEAQAPAAAVPAQEQAPAATGSVTLVSPADGQGRQYDETSDAAEFRWDGSAAFIVFARNSSMSPETMRVPVSGSSYKFHNPWPGEWYWRVDAADGSKSEVRRFSVAPPPRVGLSIASPASGGSVAGTGGQVAWNVDSSRVAFFRVELSNGSWANPAYRFATGTTSVALQGVTPGSYQMRVGAFSEVSGRWEYTAPMPVTVQ